MRLAEYEASVCSCGCGLPIDVAHDPKQGFLVHKYTCHARKAIEKVRREAEEKAKEGKWAEGWKDGLHYYAVTFNPDTDEPPPTAEPRRRRGGPRG